MTHVRNVEGFEKLVDFCTGYGGKYKPGSPNLQVEMLHAQLQSVKAAMDRVKITKSVVDSEVNHRKQEFAELPRLASSILFTLVSSGAKPEALDDARLFVRQIAGYTVRDFRPDASTNPEAVKSRRSTLQQAYTHKADWFGKLVQTLEMEPLYNPNEQELKKKNLLAKASALVILNKQVISARVAWSNALVERNMVMYMNEKSIVNTFRAVKMYIRAAFGLNSLEYGQIKSLQLTKPARA